MSHFEGANAAGEERLILLMPSVPQFRSIDFYESLHDDSTSPPFNPRVPVGFFFFFTFVPLSRFLPMESIHRCPETYIPLSPFEFEPDRPFSRSLCGIWYDPLTDDYFIVQATYNLPNCASHVEFFSLRADAWKQIEKTESYKHALL